MVSTKVSESINGSKELSDLIDDIYKQYAKYADTGGASMGLSFELSALDAVAAIKTKNLELTLCQCRPKCFWR